MVFTAISVVLTLFKILFHLSWKFETCFFCEKEMPISGELLVGLMKRIHYAAACFRQ